MKKHGSTIILVAVFFVGLSVLLYPTVSDYWNSRTQSRAVASYGQTVASMSVADFDDYFGAAEDYNRRLYNCSDALAHPEQLSGYTETLDITGTGIMGFITIDKLKLELPIYHGTSDGVLQIAVGHLEGSSLPVGGESTHSVLVAHRGLPSAKLFSELDELVEGDTFTITILDEVLTYEVDLISIVLPTEVDTLDIEEGKDYCTLLTCTPYGINSHRLLVRGTRIETLVKPQIYVAADAYRIDTLIVAPAVASPILFVLLVYLLIKYRKKKN